MNYLFSQYATLRSRGILYSAGVVFNRLMPARIFRLRLFQILELKSRTQEPSKPTPDVSDLAVVRCTSDCLLRQAEKLTFTKICKTDPAHQHQTAWLAQFGDDAAGGLWTTRQSFDETELGVRIELPEDSTWLYAAYVDKAFRRRGVYGRLLQSVIEQIQEQDSQRVYVSINPTNRASMSAHRDFVHRKLGTCLAAKCFQISFCWSFGSTVSSSTMTFNVFDRPVKLRWRRTDKPSEA